MDPQKRSPQFPKIELAFDSAPRSVVVTRGLSGLRAEHKLTAILDSSQQMQAKNGQFFAADPLDCHS